MSLKIHKLNDELDSIELARSWLNRRKIALKQQLNELANAEVNKGDVFTCKKTGKLFIVLGAETPPDASTLLYIEGIVINRYQPYDIILEQHVTSVELSHLLSTHAKLDWKVPEEAFKQLEKSQLIIDEAKRVFENEMKVLCSIENNFRMS